MCSDASRVRRLSSRSLPINFFRLQQSALALAYNARNAVAVAEHAAVLEEEIRWLSSIARADT